MPTVTRYAQSVHTCDLWQNCPNALGAPDNSCASTNLTIADQMNLQFGNIVPVGAIIDSAILNVKIAVSGGNYCIIILDNLEGDNDFWDIDGFGHPLCLHSAWLGEKNVLYLLNTASKVNGCLLGFNHVAGAGGVPWTAHVDSAYLKITYHGGVCVVSRVNWPFYIAFAKRAFHFHYRYDQPTADNEVEVLKQEFLLRGLQECALDQIMVIAKQVGEDAKAADG